MEWAVLTHIAAESLARHGNLNLSDLDLVRRLRDRDGKLPLRSPSHTRNGRCKYMRYYPTGGCPWCSRVKVAA
jgi:hypothetical protein